MHGFTGMYAEMHGYGDEKYDRGFYYYPVFELTGDATIEDFEGDEIGYVGVMHHSLTFERYMTENDAVHRVAEAIAAHHKAGNISTQLLEDTIDHHNQYSVEDILNEGEQGVRVSTFVKDKSLIYRAAKMVLYA